MLNKEIMLSEHYLNELSKTAVGRKELMEKYKLSLLTGDWEVFLLSGMSGSGKSSVLAVLAEFLNESGYNTLPFVAGSSMYKSRVEDFVMQAVFYLENCLCKPINSKALLYAGITEDEDSNIHPMEWCDYLYSLCTEYINNKDMPPLVFILDGAEKLCKTEPLLELSFIPHTLGGKIKFIISYDNFFEMPQLSTQYKMVKYYLPQLENEEQIRDFTKNVFTFNNSTLSEETAIYAAEKCTEKSVFDTFVITHTLMMMSKYDCTDELLKDTSATHPTQSLIKLAQNIIGEELIDAFLSLISLTNHGIYTEDLLPLINNMAINCTVESISEILNILAPLIIQKPDGKIDTTQNVKTIYAEKNKEKNIYLSSLLEYAKTLDAKCEFIASEGVSLAYQSDDKEFFLSIANADVGGNTAIIRSISDICEKYGVDWLLDVCSEQLHPVDYRVVSNLIGKSMLKEVIFSQPTTALLLNEQLGLRAENVFSEVSFQHRMWLSEEYRRAGVIFKENHKVSEAKYYLDRAAEIFYNLYLISGTPHIVERYLSAVYHYADLCKENGDIMDVWQITTDVIELANTEMHSERELAATLFNFNTLGKIVLYRAHAAMAFRRLAQAEIYANFAINVFGSNHDSTISYKKDTASIGIAGAKRVIAEINRRNNDLSSAVLALKEAVERYNEIYMETKSLKYAFALMSTNAELIVINSHRNEVQGVVQAARAWCNLYERIRYENDFAQYLRSAVSEMLGAVIDYLNNRFCDINDGIISASYKNEQMESAELLYKLCMIAQKDTQANFYNEYMRKKGEEEFENSKETTDSLNKKLQKVVSENDWKSLQIENTHNIHVSLNGIDEPVCVTASVDKDEFSLSFISMGDFLVPSEYRAEIARAVCYINCYAEIGSVDFDIPSAKIKYRYTFNYKDCAISESLLSKIISNAAYFADAFIMKLKLITEGEYSSDKFEKFVFESYMHRKSINQ